MSTHATLLSKSPAKATWTSNARTNLRTKKESWPNMLPDRRACARRSMAHLAKMPLLQLPNCQRSFAAEAALGPILPSPSIEQLPRLPYQWTEADKAAHPCVEKMPYQPLATRGGLSTGGQAAPSAEPHNISARGGRVKLRAR
jgi:hypothetical protein